MPPIPLLLRLQKYAVESPEHIALINPTTGQELTFAQLVREFVDLVEVLVAHLGCSKEGNSNGQRIALLLSRGQEFVVAQYATWAAGCVCVPLCVSHPISEPVYRICDSQPALIVLHNITSHLKGLITEAFDYTGFFLVSSPIHPTGDHPPIDVNTVSFNDTSSLDNRALIIYTSGTTSKPKGCVLTHRNISVQAESLARSWRHTPHDRILHISPLHHVHGNINMTETGLVLTNGLGDDKKVVGSIRWRGEPVYGPRGRGSLQFRGENVFLEYWEQRVATTEAFTADGWFKTGDVVTRGQAGAYFIDGREVLDIIKTGGYSVSALEVERVMGALGEVLEVVVVSVEDDTWGQRVGAVVTQRPGTEPVTLMLLRTRLRNHIAFYKIPTVVRIVDSIHRNARGKIDKTALVGRYWPGCPVQSAPLRRKYPHAPGMSDVGRA